MSLDQDVKTTLEKLKQVNSDQATKSIEAKETLLEPKKVDLES